MVLKTCCHCIDLRKASLISGYLLLVYHTVMLAMQIFTMMSIYLMTQGLDENSKRGILFNIFTLLIVVYAIIIFLELLNTIVLLVGLHKNKPVVVLTTIASTVILLIIDLAIFIWTTFQYLSQYSVKDWFLAVLHLLFIILYVYFLCIFGSYYKKMREGKIVTNIGEKSKSYV